ncbi:hypothetical protein AT746_04505 [Lacimicrobium alkaliphilum]|uniref:Uncharacterized protein n=1 Tax=Lacimicrobium alkaliphilum TaxID=1526571 RepID=A0A0U2Z3W1_9ALTE|nr:hypothetical protein AT746_04505 [Lacimicrobium alkaliphilum]
MTDSGKSVEQLYQQRKRQLKAPRQNREYVLSKANNQTGKGLSGFNFWNWTLGISLCAGVIVLFSIVGNVQQQLQSPPSKFRQFTFTACTKKRIRCWHPLPK